MTMQVTPGKLSGVFLLEPKRFEDDRGFFATLWTTALLQDLGVCTDFVQANLSFNKQKNTLRGLHFQHAPYTQDKLVRCNRGSVFDLLLDLRPDSSTYGQWESYELNSTNPTLLYVPKGLAHSFLTLEDNTEFFYEITAPYTPQAEDGIQWNDPAFDLIWPELDGERIVSPKDQQWPLWHTRTQKPFELL